MLEATATAAWGLGAREHKGVRRGLQARARTAGAFVYEMPMAFPVARRTPRILTGGLPPSFANRNCRTRPLSWA